MMYICKAGNIKIIILAIIIILTNMKTIDKIMKTSIMNNQGKVGFISKFDYGKGKGTVRFQFKQYHPVRQKPIQETIYYGLLPYENYLIFRQKKTCQQKRQLFIFKGLIDWDDYLYFRRTILIEQQKSQQIWFLYIYNCQLNHQDQYWHDISFNVVFMNNDSHFGQDEKIILPYIILVAIWAYILIKYGPAIFKTFSHQRPDQTRILVYAGVFTLGIAYFYKLLHLFVYSYDGQGIFILNIFYIILKNVTQGINVTVIISIAWGWSIVHLKHDQIYVLMGIISALMNVIGLILVNLAEQMQQNHHEYQTLAGYSVLIIRVALVFIFIFGILRSMASSAGKIRQFIKKLGITGTLYLLAWPLTVLFCQLFLPAYMHLQIIKFVEEGTHIIANAYLCQMLSYPQSQYRKLSKKQQDNPFDSPARQSK